MDLPQAQSQEEAGLNQATTLAALIQLLIRKGVFTNEEMSHEAMKAKVMLAMLMAEQAGESP